MIYIDLQRSERGGSDLLRLALPLPRAPDLLDLDRHCERLRTAAIAGAAHGRRAEIIEADRDADMGLGGANAVGGVESDPAEIWHEGFGPGMAGRLIDHAVRAQEMPGDEPRRYAARARTCDED